MEVLRHTNLDIIDTKTDSDHMSNRPPNLYCIFVRIHACCNIRMIVWVRLGVYMDRSGSGFCPTCYRPNRIGWRKFRRAADWRGSRIGAVGFTLESIQFGWNYPQWKNPAKIVYFRRNFARSGGISSDLVRFPPYLAKISLDSMRSPKYGINLVGSKVFWPKTRWKKLESPDFGKFHGRVGWGKF